MATAAITSSISRTFVAIPCGPAAVFPARLVKDNGRRSIPLVVVARGLAVEATLGPYVAPASFTSLPFLVDTTATVPATRVAAVVDSD